MDPERAHSSRRPAKSSQRRTPHTSSQATTRDSVAFAVPGESEASGGHGDALRDPHLGGTVREGNVIWAVVNNHELSIFDVLSVNAVYHLSSADED